jgi:hypothetical protein
MASPSFPGALDALANPGPTTETDDAGFELDIVVSRLQNCVMAIETKLGIGGAGPGAASAVLRQTATGASAWGALAVGDVDAASRMVLAAQTPIINGGFEIWQRGLGAVTHAGTSALPTNADRWTLNNLSDAVVATAPNTTLPAVAALVPATTYALQLLTSTPDTSMGTAQYCYLTQKIEGAQWLPVAQKQFTIGFWVRSAISGTYSLGVSNSALNQTCVTEYSIAPGEVNTWVYRTCTFPASGAVTVANGWNITTGVGLYLFFTLAGGTGAGSNAATGPLNTWNADGKWYSPNQANGVSTGGNVFIWGVTLGLGATVAPYWPRLYGQELALCQRYLSVEQPGSNNAFSGVGQASTAATAFISFKHAVEMRSAPTIGIPGVAANYVVSDGVTSTACNASPTLSVATRYATRIQFPVAGGLTQYRPYYVIDNASGVAAIILSAEL